MAQEDDMDLSGEVAAGCLCFRGFGSYQQLGDHDEGWFVRKAKEIRGMSELVAGPKWKTFIRKFFSVQGKNKIKRVEFGYDAESYALNFDDGNYSDEDEDRKKQYAFMVPPVRSDGW